MFLLNSGYPRKKIISCINKTDDGKNSWQRSFKDFCLKTNIQIFDLVDLYRIPDLVFISLEFDQIIKIENFLSKELFNIHFSLLPKYKGMYTSTIPILNNEIESGVTLHLIDNGIDTGDIIEQEKFPIINLTAIQIYHRYLDVGLILFQRNIFNLLNGNYYSTKQLAIDSSYYSKSSIDYANIRIDLNRTAHQIMRQIDAYSFRPYQLPNINGSDISFTKILSSCTNAKPGILLFEDDNKFVYSTIDYDIELYKDKIFEILHLCEIDGYQSLSNYLKYGYNINDFGHRGWTPLIVSVFNNSKKCIELLLRENADVNAINFNGTTVLMYAMSAALKSGDYSIMTLLIKQGAKLDTKDFSNKTIFDYALEHNAKEIIEYLNNILMNDSIS